MKCPYCNETFYPHMKVCNRKIASGKNKEGKRSSKKAIEEKKNFYLQIKEYCKVNPGKELSTNLFLNLYNIKGITEGDTIRLILDKLVCEGYLTKKEFNCAKGHSYISRGNDILPCTFFQEGSIFPVCIAPKEEFKDIGEYNEKEQIQM